MSYLDNLKDHFLEWTVGKWAELERFVREKDEMIRLYEMELSPERVKEIRIRVRLSVLALVLASQQLQQGSRSSSSWPACTRQGQSSTSTSKPTPRPTPGSADKRKKQKRKQKDLSSSVTTGIAVGSPGPARISESHHAGKVDTAKLKSTPLSPASAASALRQKLRDKFNSCRKGPALKMVPLRFPSAAPEAQRKPKLRRRRLRDIIEKIKRRSFAEMGLEVIDVDEPTMPVATSPAPGSSRSLSGSASATPSKRKGNVDVAPPDSDGDEISVVKEIVMVRRAKSQSSSNETVNGGGTGWNVDDGAGGKRSRPKLHGRAPITRFQYNGRWLSYFNCICGYRSARENALERHLRKKFLAKLGYY